MDEAALTEAVMTYLARHFSQVAITGTVPFDRDGHGVSFLVDTGEGEYRLNVLDEAVAGLDRDGMVELLEGNRVASVMRDLVGFPLTLTRSGCIFGDL